MPELPSLLASSLDTLLLQAVAAYGAWALAAVAAVVFAETGLVIAPLLPGDSLLFATGSVMAASGLSVHGAVLLLVVAAVLGDGVNFAIGRRAGPWALERGRWLRPRHLAATQAYFVRFGGWTVVVARFVPIVRTVAPFLAGVGGMAYRRFGAFNVLGAVLWVASLVYAGALLGGHPWVRGHLGALTLGVVALSVLPVAWGAVRAGLRARRSAP